MDNQYGDLASIDFDDDDLVGTGLDGNTSQEEPPFDPDNYVKPYLGYNGEPEPDIKGSNPLGNDGEPSEEDLITILLKEKGIKDASSIKYEEEDGIVVEKDFYSLPLEEQMAILKSEETIEDNYDLSDDEIDIINDFRELGMSPNEYVEALKAQAIQEYLQNLPNTVQYEIDSLNDDELYILDLQDNYPDLTEDELASALSHERANPTLFQKKMEGLRNMYKQKEDERLEEERALQTEEDAREAAKFTETIQSSVGRLEKIGEFVLEDDDKEEVAEFLLGTDKTGQRWISRALNDPDTLTQMAWFALKGEEALDALSDYYKNEIQERTREAYNRGLEEGTKKNTAQVTRTTVVRTPPPTPKTEKKESGGFRPLNSPHFINLD